VKAKWKTVKRFVPGRDSSVHKLRMPVGGTTGIAAG
jgi:hypothetical protein